MLIAIVLMLSIHSDSFAQKTITSIYVTFNTTNEDKDHDTWIRFQVQAADGSWLGNREGTFGKFPNNSSYCYALNLGDPYYNALLLNNSYLYLLIVPNGDDSWNFGWVVTINYNYGSPSVITGTGSLNESYNSFRLRIL